MKLLFFRIIIAAFPWITNSFKYCIVRLQIKNRFAQNLKKQQNLPIFILMT